MFPSERFTRAGLRYDNDEADMPLLDVDDEWYYGETKKQSMCNGRKVKGLLCLVSIALLLAGGAALARATGLPAVVSGLLHGHGDSAGYTGRDAEVNDIVQVALSPESVAHIDASVARLVQFGTRHTASDTESQSEGIGAARQWIRSQFQSFSPRLQVEFDFFDIPEGGAIPHAVSATNVVATLPGSDPSDDRVIIISGHFDSRSTQNADFASTAPGANDDASGTVTVLEAARLLSAPGVVFPCTLVFAAFAGEEQGLFGSKDLANKMSASNTNVYAMLNNDIVGGERLSSETALDDPVHVRVFSMPGSGTGGGLNTNDSPQRLLARYIADVADQYLSQVPFAVKMQYRPDRFLRGGDQNSFNDVGYTAVRFTEMNENFDHQHQDVREEHGTQFGDLLEFMRPEYVSRVLALNVASAASLAWAPGPPTQVRILVSRLDNLSDLSWDVPSASPGRVHNYRILVRETAAPRWNDALSVVVPGSQLSVSLPISKDNFLFAVQALDEQGRASMPVFPVAGSGEPEN